MSIRTLRQLAECINALPPCAATVRPSWSSTDSKVAGTRQRRQGLGRNGTKIVVLKRGKPLFDHDTSECYRTVAEAVVKAEELVSRFKPETD